MCSQSPRTEKFRGKSISLYFKLSDLAMRNMILLRIKISNLDLLYFFKLIPGFSAPNAPVGKR